MIDLAAQALHKYYGTNHVLKGISFEIYSNERIGLLGRNGSGKTTLFKTLCGQEPYEDGSVTKASGKRIEILAQIPSFGAQDTVEDILASSFQEVNAVHTAMKKLEGDADPAALARYGRLMEEYERLGGYDAAVRIDKICTGMHIPADMRARPFSLLSGGEQTRVNLARILLRDCDILLLDEPTNHLDLDALAWLEKFLRDFPGTVVVISHDRAFLDNVVTRIIEIREGVAHFYAGNYSFYVEEKQRRFDTQAEQYKQQQHKIRQLEVAAKRMHDWAVRADSGALHKRAFAMEKRIERMDKVERPATERKINEDFISGGHAAREVVSFDAVRKRYGDKVLMNGVDLRIRRNDSIALIGDNGCGKTTLLRLITGEEPCDSGLVKVSSNVRIACMPQIIRFEDEDKTILDTLRYACDLTEEKARSVLAGFRFSAADVAKRVASLSGGERSRLKLCLLMQSKANFLILDEPTNHLDIASREWIEDAVDGFDGTLLFISHDRYFLHKFAATVWHMQDGAVRAFDCTYDEYLRRTAPPVSAARAPAEAKKKKSAPAPKPAAGKPVPVEARIQEAEAALRALDEAIEASFAARDFKMQSLLYRDKEALEAELDALYSEWLEEE